MLQKTKTTSNNDVCTSLQQKAMCACMLVHGGTKKSRAYSTPVGHTEGKAQASYEEILSVFGYYDAHRPPPPPSNLQPEFLPSIEFYKSPATQAGCELCSLCREWSLWIIVDASVSSDLLHSYLYITCQYTCWVMYTSYLVRCMFANCLRVTSICTYKPESMAFSQYLRITKRRWLVCNATDNHLVRVYS